MKTEYPLFILLCNPYERENLALIFFPHRDALLPSGCSGFAKAIRNTGSVRQMPGSQGRWTGME